MTRTKGAKDIQPRQAETKPRKCSNCGKDDHIWRSCPIIKKQKDRTLEEKEAGIRFLFHYGCSFDEVFCAHPEFKKSRIYEIQAEVKLEKRNQSPI